MNTADLIAMKYFCTANIRARDLPGASVLKGRKGRRWHYCTFKPCHGGPHSWEYRA